jgi:TolB-like protein
MITILNLPRIVASMATDRQASRFPHLGASLLARSRRLLRRISGELVKISDGFRLWSELYDWQLDDLGIDVHRVNLSRVPVAPPSR